MKDETTVKIQTVYCSACHLATPKAKADCIHCSKPKHLSTPVQMTMRFQRKLGGDSNLVAKAMTA